MQISRISFQGKRLYQPSLPLKYNIGSEKEAKIMEYVKEADKAWQKLIKTSSVNMANRHAGRMHSNLDRAIALLPEKEFINLPNLDGKPFDSQQLLAKKYLYSLLEPSKENVPSVKEIIDINPKTKTAKIFKKMWGDMSKIIKGAKKFH